MQKEDLVITGKNPVLEALKSGRAVNKILLAEKSSGKQEILEAAKTRGIPVQKTTKSKLSYLSGGKNHQGVAAFLAAKDYVELEELIEICNQVENPVVLILDELQDPQNLGAIIRSVEALGSQGIIIPKRRSVSLSDTVARTSAGTLEYVPVCRATNLAETIKLLQEKGFWVVGCDADGEELIHNLDLTGSIGVVIGSEGKGIRRLVKEKCDFLARIPMKGKVNSLNASAATSIVLFEIVRQRI